MPPEPREIELLQAVLDALPGYVAYYDADERLRYANAAYLRSTGTTGGDPIGRHLRDLRGEAFHARVTPHVQAVLRGEAQEVESELVDAGVIRYMRVRYLPHVVGGVVAGFVLHGEDATERRAAADQLGERLQQRAAALQASERRFERAFRSSPAAIAIRRAVDGRVVDVNDRYSELTGYAREDVLGRLPAEIGTKAPARWAARDAALSAMREAGGSLAGVELPFLTKAGEPRVALASLEEIEIEGEGTCVVNTFIDITDRKRGERRLAVQAEVSRLLAEAQSLGDVAASVLRALGECESWAIGALWQPDASGDRLACVDVWTGGPEGGPLAEKTRAMTFARGEGAPGRVWSSGRPLLLEDVRQAAGFLRTEEATRAGLTSAIVFPILHHDEVLGVVDFIGTPRPLDPQIEAFLAAIGRQLGVFLARTRAVAATRVSEERLQTVIENLGEGLVLADARGRVLHWNPAARELHGLPSTEDWNHALADFPAYFELATLDGKVLDLAEWPLARILAGEVVRDCEVRVSRRDIEWSRVFSYGGTLVRQTDGSLVAVVTMRDMTERLRRDELRRLTEHLTEENRRIQEASRLKDEFLANMSHELRTPLNAIIGFSSLLVAGKAGPLTADQREYLGDVLSSSHHLHQLINDILDLAKVEAGRVEVVLEDVDVESLVNEVRDIARGLAPERDVPIRIAVAPELARIRADARIVRQILFNYVSNALKFTHSGEIWIRIVPQSDSELRIEVEDTGIGIAEGDVDRLFVAFQQLDAGPRKKYQGTGLGLALTRRLAEAIGGRAGATSQLGQGSTFFVVLPRAPEVAPHAGT